MVGAGSRVNELWARAREGDVAALSMLISTIESRSATGQAAMGDIYAETGYAHVVGITGAPGSGKSTLVAALAREFRARGLRVAIVAVDPSSSLSGGAILGDRIRMSEHTLDENIFIRSMSSRGLLGGVARATFDVVALLDATGWDVVIVETVGVGQAEVEIVEIAQTTVVVSVPGLGDDIQVIKSGLLEVADIHVVNKVDRPDANKTMRELLGMLNGSASKAKDAWTIPVLGTSAVSGIGVVELADALDDHRVWVRSSRHRARQERDQAVARVRAVIRDLVVERMQDPVMAIEFEEIIDDVVKKCLHPYEAAARLLDRISGSNPIREGLRA